MILAFLSGQEFATVSGKMRVLFSLSQTEKLWFNNLPKFPELSGSTACIWTCAVLNPMSLLSPSQYSFFENVILNVLPAQKMLMGRSIPALLRLSHQQHLTDGQFVLGTWGELCEQSQLSLIPPSSLHLGCEASGEKEFNFPTSGNQEEYYKP